MRKILINIGERSKQAFAQPINTYKKNKVLSDYLRMIRKNKHLIINDILEEKLSRKDALNIYGKKII